uniref:Peptidase M13 N-terminal domain-containing protein n=1 Tax=Glossina austeni TaxID=7395 RepID=A0A1A9VUH3_GLOAU
MSPEIVPCDVEEDATYTHHPDDAASVRINTRSPRINRRKWPLEPSSLNFKYILAVVTCISLGAALTVLIMHNIQSDDDCAITDLKYKNYKICLTERCVQTAFHLMEGMNTSVDPCEDFYQYACGNWKKEHRIPEADTSISTFKLLGSKILDTLKTALEEPIASQDNYAIIKAKEFYRSCVNTGTVQIRKIAEDRLKKILKSLGGWPVIEDNWRLSSRTIEEILGILHRKYNVAVLLELHVGVDEKNSSTHILKLDQPPLPLYSRDVYLNSDAEKARRAYHKYMTETAVLLGANRSTAAQDFEEVLQFEIQLANATIPKADRRDLGSIYEKFNLIDLQEKFPELNWAIYLQTFLGTNIRLPLKGEFVVYGIKYVAELTKLISRTDRRVLHNCVLWRLVRTVVVFLLDEYNKNLLEFHRALVGTRGEVSRWGQCIMWTNRNLGLAVGALFIKDNFDPRSKEIAFDMIRTIREAFNELLDENDWMDNPTRAVAKEKANAMNQLVGYPEVLTNVTALENVYKHLTIVADDFMENVWNILRWEVDKNLLLLSQPVEKKVVPFNPTAINAYYDFHKNDIGRQFDKDGNMMQWWNNATIEAFRARTQCIIDQYSNYKVAEVDMHLNGRITQGENIADNGGLKQAFRAYKKWVKQNGPEPLLPGLNLKHEQIFFVNFAQMWCESERPESLMLGMAIANHPPGDLRVRGSLSNSKDFAEAYQCKPGSPMNPIKKCSVW